LKDLILQNTCIYYILHKVLKSTFIFKVRFEENRETRVKEIMKRLLKIKDDLDWTNGVLDYQNTRGDLQRFVNEKLRPLYKTQISTNIPDDDLEEEICKLPENFTSTWSV